MSLGLAVYVVRPVDFETVLESIERIGGVLGRDAAARARVAAMRRDADAIARAVAGAPRPRVLYVVWPNPLIAPGRGTLINELIQRAGGESVTGAEPLPYPRLSLETVVERRPDRIIVGRHGQGTVEELLRGWERLGSRQRRARGPRVRRRRRPRPPAGPPDGRGAPRAGPRDPPGARAVISRRRVRRAPPSSSPAASCSRVSSGSPPARRRSAWATSPPRWWGGRRSDLAATVVLELRLPRVLLAALAGGGLAVAGAAFQALTRNPLADPAVLGVAGGAALGAVLGHLWGLEGSLAGDGGALGRRLRGRADRGDHRVPHRRVGRGGCRSRRCSWPG